MGQAWTSQRVLELAPDGASAKSGQDLSRPAKWAVLGRTDRALWGEIKGSGKSPYQVRIDLSEPAFKCSCLWAAERKVVVNRSQDDSG